MRRALRASGFATVLAIGGCGSGGLSISSDHDPVQDFDRYRMYAWSVSEGDVAHSPIVDDFIDERVREAVDAALTDAGLERTALDQAEMTVGYLVRVDPQVERQLGPGAPTVDRYGGTFDESASDRWFREGTLEIALVDVRRQRVVWRGVAHAEMDPATTPREREQRIERAVREIMERLPR